MDLTPQSNISKWKTHLVRILAYESVEKPIADDATGHEYTISTAQCLLLHSTPLDVIADPKTRPNVTPSWDISKE